MQQFINRAYYYMLLSRHGHRLFSKTDKKVRRTVCEIIFILLYKSTYANFVPDFALKKRGNFKF